MTVLELVKELNKYDPDTNIKIWNFTKGGVSVALIEKVFIRNSSLIIATGGEEI